MASISGFVWQDGNGNGSRDAAEGVGGVTIRLTRFERAQPDPDMIIAVHEMNTDLSGAYAFAGLWPGKYRVAVEPPAGQDLFDGEPAELTVIIADGDPQAEAHDFRLM